MNNYIQKLIEEGEHLKQDFKFEISDARKIAKTLSAFANTAGGKLLIGVKDNGKIAGIRSEEEIFMVEAAASMYCKPEVMYTSRKYSIAGKSVLEIDVPKGKNRPYLAKTAEGKWLAYIRVHDQNFLVNALQIKVWKSENRNKGVFIPFTDNEKVLLEYLHKNNTISLEEFCLKASINRKRAKDILFRLILIHEIEIVYKDEEILYSLKKR